MNGPLLVAFLVSVGCGSPISPPAGGGAGATFTPTLDQPWCYDLVTPWSFTTAADVSDALRFTEIDAEGIEALHATMVSWGQHHSCPRVSGDSLEQGLAGGCTDTDGGRWAGSWDSQASYDEEELLEYDLNEFSVTDWMAPGVSFSAHGTFHDNAYFYTSGPSQSGLGLDLVWTWTGGEGVEGPPEGTFEWNGNQTWRSDDDRREGDGRVRAQPLDSDRSGDFCFDWVELDGAREVVLVGAEVVRTWRGSAQDCWKVQVNGVNWEDACE